MSHVISKKDIINYYDLTFFEYNFILGLGSHLGMHYGYYDNNHKTYAEANRNLNCMIAKLANVTKGMKVLDAGCGVGGSVIWLAKNIGAEAIGITLSKTQVEKAKMFAQKYEVRNLTQFMVGDYTHTKFPDKSFDVVWAIESVCHAKEKLDFIKESYRILKPGGCLIVSDGFIKKRKITDSEKELIRKWLMGWKVPSLEYMDQFIEKMKSVGFKNIHKKDVSENVMPFSKRLYKWAKILNPIAQVLRFLGIFSRVNTGNVIAAAGQYPALKQGLWQYGIVWGRK
ncbi:hypothetical protein A2867_02760 [Candidatus Daviesbacteria bacterium RIFCSPHIGHO2_01_FULL_40_11]|uniref:Methyltransferase type 11 domain-containing protein n=1 Tax=Candidatus Daviesbacteria bacterium RIFCSPHIGHO2_01_FULL_40_11 TaxID=1797762 RepID=A0A1F5JKQ3_9BACT|nr:MAG: hypothetical protein A2867_02760 [Candidatus Daviesbacteria bacterium RIFCSPHIGHO2_01_FULL_40_11]OGE62956.1 MAG: hypothetical protein A2964_01585 [Candidatus Daviesbacteria bacterium RIFCSPLOWO2_01_FULL_40_27]